MLLALTGATGFVGQHVVPLLIRRGHRVRALVRDPTRAEGLATQGADLVPGDLADGTALARLVAGVEAVIHLVGIIVEAGAASYAAVHVEGTRRLLAAAADAGVRRFVHMSAVGARDEPGATRYHRTKWQGEELVRHSGLAYVIVRPSIISGPESAPIRTLARLHRWLPAVPVFGDACFPTQPVWSDDVALALSLAAERADLTGAFELGGPQLLTYEDFVLTIGRVSRHPRPLIHVPLELARWGTSVLELLGPAAPITSAQLQMLVEGSATPGSVIETVFGISPLGFEEGLKRFL